MVELKGKYNSAKVFTDNLESTAFMQIENLLDKKFVKGSKIRIMPDAHAGAGCTIGTTMTIKDKIVPNLVGVDIGCGVETVVLKNKKINLARLDETINRNIPSSFSIRRSPHEYLKKIDLHKLKAARDVNIQRAELSIGTLGGGNHFIEVGKDQDENLYLTVHSGSRNLGKQIADHYQKLAIRDMAHKSKAIRDKIFLFEREGKEKNAESHRKKLELYDVERSLAFLEGDLFHDYLHDMEIVQRYAKLNRLAIVDEIVTRMDLDVDYQFTTTHNYIDIDSMILRKGAISAKKGERVLIPINMRDGSLICIGKGNEDWNYSAPHGAGRIMSRTAAKANIKLSDFEKSMKGIYSSTVSKRTLDEAPFAYKPMQEIIDNIHDTVTIEKVIKPIYNFKAPE